MKRIVGRENIERLMFEAWWKVRTGADHLEAKVDDDGNVYYDDVNINHLWQGWLGRSSVARSYKR